MCVYGSLLLRLPSDIRVDEVVYETIDPDKNSGEGLCVNNVINCVLFPVITITGEAVLWYPAMQPME